MKIWHVSDTHCKQDQLVIPVGIDTVVHSGDASNQRDPFLNEAELHRFIDWLADLPIKNRVFVAGNHDTSLEKGLITADYIRSRGIVYLNNEDIIIDGLKFWGSPFTTAYGDWAFMKARHKICRVWETIPDDTDILVTHGPPYNILDSTYNSDNKIELCGDTSLMKRIMKLNLKLMCFGHIHSTHDIRNAGTRTISGSSTIYSNGSCCDDGRNLALTSHGNIIEIS